MTTAASEAPTNTPSSVTAPAFSDFLARRRDAAKQAVKADQPVQTQAGQSEPAKETDQPAPEAKAPESEKTDKKEKTAEELKQELSNQAKANLRLGKEKADLQKQIAEMAEKLKVIEAKQDGTYQPPSEEQQQREAVLRDEWNKFEQRKESSKDAAIKEFGEDYVLNQIYHESGPYTKLAQEKPWMVQRVIAAEKPVHEAIAAVNEEAVLTKFGRTEADVLKKAEEILRPKLFEQFKTELINQDGGAKPPATVPSLNQARSAGADPRLAGTEPVRTFSAGKLFPHNRV